MPVRPLPLPAGSEGLARLSRFESFKLLLLAFPITPGLKSTEQLGISSMEGKQSTKTQSSKALLIARNKNACRAGTPSICIWSLSYRN